MPLDTLQGVWYIGRVDMDEQSKIAHESCCDHIGQGSGHMSQRNKKDLLTRMRRLEGQVRGITKMIEEDRYCVDILLQISASRAGLQKVGLSLLEGHTRGCVTAAIKEDRGDEMVQELIDVLDRFMK